MTNTTKPGVAQIAPYNPFRKLTDEHLKHRHRLIPIEPGQKRPAFFDGVEWKPYPVWQKAGELTGQRLASYKKPDTSSMGLVLGMHPALAANEIVAVFDMDVTDAALKAAVEPVMQAAGIMEFLRFGNPEKMGAAFVIIELPEGVTRFGKQVIDFGGGQKIELLADGAQVLLDGLHPLGVPYAWADPVKALPAAPITALPRLTQAQYHEIAAELAQAGAVSAPSGGAGTGSPCQPGYAEFVDLPQPEARQLQAAMAEARNDFLREDWVQVVKVYKRCCEDALGPEQVYADLLAFDLRCPSGSDGGTALDRVLAEDTLPDSFGLRQLCKELAKRMSADTGEALRAMARRVLAQKAFDGVPVDNAIVEQLMQRALAVAQAGVPAFQNATLKNTEPKTLADLLAGGLDKLPPRSWEVRGLLMRGALAVIGGAGGSGKSSLLNGVALSVASGLPLMGFDLRNPAGEPVLILNADDDEAEIARRFGALAQFYKVPAAALGRVHVLGMDKLGDARACRVQGRGGELVFNGDWLDRVAEWIERTGAKVVILDPLAGIADLDENSNEHMGAFAGWLNAFAAAKGVAVVLVHHASKGGVAAAAATGGDRNANLIAGGRRLLDKARAAFVIDSLGEADAPHVGMGKGDDRLNQMFGLWSVKGNYMARGAARAYFRMEAVGLNNARGLDPADTVGVAARFTPVKAAATDAVLLAILDLIAAGSSDGPYTRKKTGGSKRFLPAAVIGAVDWRAEGLDGPPGGPSILAILEDKVLKPELAEERNVDVKYASRKGKALGLVLTPEGQGELDRLKAEYNSKNSDLI